MLFPWHQKLQKECLWKQTKLFSVCFQQGGVVLRNWKYFQRWWTWDKLIFLSPKWEFYPMTIWFDLKSIKVKLFCAALKCSLSFQWQKWLQSLQLHCSKESFTYCWYSCTVLEINQMENLWRWSNTSQIASTGEKAEMFSDAFPRLSKIKLLLTFMNAEELCFFIDAYFMEHKWKQTGTLLYYTSERSPHPRQFFWTRKG